MIEQLFAIFPWQLIVFLSGIVTGFSHFVRKSQLHRLGVFQVGFWKDISSMGVAVLLYLLLTPQALRPELWWVVAAGFGAALGNGAYMSALRGDMSGTSTFSTSAGQLFILLGSFVWFGEWRYFEPTNVQGLINLVCVVLFFGGMYLYNSDSSKVLRWWKLILLGVFFNVLVNFAAKYLSDVEVSSAQSTMGLYFGNVLGDVLLLAWKKQRAWIGLKDVSLGLLQGALGGFAVFLYLQAMSIGPLSLVSITRRVAIMGFTILMGMTVFGERKTVTWKKVVGLVMALAVFGLVAWANS